MVSKENDIIILTELYVKEFGVTLTPQDAVEELAKLRQLYKFVYLSTAPLQKPVILSENNLPKIKAVHTPYRSWYTVPATHRIIR